MLTKRSILQLMYFKDSSCMEWVCSFLPLLLPALEKKHAVTWCADKVDFIPIS